MPRIKELLAAANLDDPVERELHKLATQYVAANEDGRGSIQAKMLEVTQNLDEHPEWFEWPCFCAECQSYGDF